MNPVNEASINYSVITNWSDFELLKSDWSLLLEQSDANNIFLTWEWVDCWRKTQRSAIKPFIVIIKDDKHLHAIAPLYIQDYRLVNLVNYKALRFAGDNGIGSEYSDFIVNTSQSEFLKSRLWQYLASVEVKQYWDFIWFTNVSAWTAGGKSLLQSLSNITELKFNRRTVEFAQTAIQNSSEDLLTSLSKSLRTNIRQTTRRLDKIGPWKVFVSDRDSDIQGQLEKLFELHNKHWLNRGLGTFQRRPELVNFYRDFVPIALANGWLRLLHLESCGEVQAMQLGYVYNNNFLAIQEGYNPDFLPGVGQVLRYFSLNNCHMEQLNYYDFLGVYTDHKRRWLAKKKLGTNLFIWQRKVKNLPFELKKIWPSGRYLNVRNGEFKTK